MSASRWLALGLALAYWLANALLHLEFSNWVTRAWETPFGRVVPVEFTGEIALVCLVLLFPFLLWRSLRGQSRWLGWCSWALLLLAMLASNRWLLTTLVEAIHYLQYAIIAALFASVLDPRREHWPLLEILLLVFWLSVLDEAFQYLYLTTRQGTYFDFNDLWLNQLGALAGLLAYYGFAVRPPWAAGLPAWRRGLLVASLAVCVALGGLLLTGRMVIHPGGAIPPGGFLPTDEPSRLYLQREPRLYGNWQRSFSGGRYFVLSPWQGLGLILLSSLPALLQRPSWLQRAPAVAGEPP